MGGGGKTTTTVENKDPWAPSQPYLLKGFSEAGSIYDANKTGNAKWEGDFYAEARPEQLDALKGAINFANGPGQDAAFKSLNAGGSMIDQGMTGMGAAGKGLFDMAGRDATGTNISAANRYADNPYLSGMVDSAMADGRRQMSEEIIPTIERGAAATGGTNSTRTAIAQGIAERGLAEKAQGMRADLQGQAWQQGLAASQADQNRQLAALQGAGALSTDASKTGLFGLAQGLDAQKSNIETAISAGTMLNAADQTALDNKLAQFEYSKQEPWDNLNNYYGIISDGGRQGYSGTSISKVKENPSALSTAGSMAGIFASLLKCDIRFKSNISEIGALANGVKLYSFTYIDDPDQTLKIGPMAQQVLEVVPNAVETIDGILHVNMDKVISNISSEVH